MSARKKGSEQVRQKRIYALRLSHVDILEATQLWVERWCKGPVPIVKGLLREEEENGSFIYDITLEQDTAHDEKKD